MKADPEDQFDHDWQREKSPIIKWLSVAIILVGLSLAYWFWNDRQVVKQQTTSAPIVAVPAIRPEIPATPDIPRRPEPLVVEVEEAEPDVQSIQNSIPAAPTPQEEDDILRQQLGIAGADANLSALVSNENALEVSAALIDGMSRGVLMRKRLPIDPPKQKFEVDENADVLYMSRNNFTRYNSYADSIASLNSEILVNSFHTLRPLYEGAYKQLGLAPEDFDNAVIRTLDIILATPEIEGPIELERKSVMYTYADPVLEDLPPLQKLLLRMGPENVRRIKHKAQTIRDGLLSQ